MRMKIADQAVAFVSIGLLAWSLFSVVRASTSEYRRYREGRAQRAFAPTDSSLVAIKASGDLRAAGPGGVGGLPRGDSLVTFVIHAARARRDIAYWDQVIRDFDGRHPNREPVEFWGICDDGASCSAYQRTTSFPIFGYLDPYQMRIVALADAGGKALVYGGGKRASAEISLAADPSRESAMIFDASR